MAAPTLTETAQPASAEVHVYRRGKIVINDEVVIPPWVDDLESFRRWAWSEEFPQRAKISYLAGEIWVELAMEELFSHSLIRTEYTIVLGSMARDAEDGFLYTDNMRLTHPEAGLSAEPDILLAYWETIRSGRLRLVGREPSSYRELEGTPDMALEVISRSSVRKDTAVLRQRYWQAGIPEYWLVDARGAVPRFEILRHAETGYISAEAQDGWLFSTVFNRFFRLTQRTNPIGQPQYRLEVRPAEAAGPRGPEGRG